MRILKLNVEELLCSVLSSKCREQNWQLAGFQILSLEMPLIIPNSQ